jgi:hypothetical protein
MKKFAIALLPLTFAVPAVAQMRITEWQYSGDEFIEFTNLGTTSVDMTGWSFDDDSRLAGTVDLSAFGVVAPGASVILCESTAAGFAAAWSLSGIAVIGDNTSNLGRNDEINLYDAAGNLVDRLAYGDGNFPGAIRAQNAGGLPCDAAVGANDAYGWSLAYVGDHRGSVASSGGFVGNPGIHVSVDARFLTYGSGCPGTGGVSPQLNARGCPTIGGFAILDAANGAASAPAFLVYGAARSATPFGNCLIQVQPVLAAVPFALDVSGSASLSLSIPRALAAGSLTTQFLALDAGAVDGFTLSSGLELQIR